MSSTIIVRLRDRSRPDVMTDPFQADGTVDVSSLGEFLNATYSKNSAYLFYYGTERVTCNIGSVVEKHSLGVEEQLVLDYVDTEEIQEDGSYAMEDTVVELHPMNGNVYAQLYEGNLVELDGADLKHRKDVAEGVVDMAGTASLMCILHEASILCLPGGERATFPESVRNVGTVAVGDDVVALGTKNREIVLLDTAAGLSDAVWDTAAKIIPDDFYRSVIISDGSLFWIESLDVVVKYEIDGGKRTTRHTKHTLTNLMVSGTIIYASTSDGVLLALSEGGIREYPVNCRVVDRMALSRDARTLILSGQRSVFSLDIESGSERFCVFTEEQVNCMVVHGENLLLGCGREIKEYRLERFL